MDTATLLEAYGALGATGMISLLFGFMITNLIKSQTGQQETLESLKVENKGQSETLENRESMVIKLITRWNQSDDKLDRKFDALTKEINDMDNQLSEIKGSVSRINGRA
jgi:predicted RNase H-like nuclease (RuvC/YqgF family)